jgi:hypothetical protein
VLRRKKANKPFKVSSEITTAPESHGKIKVKKDD